MSRIINELGSSKNQIGSTALSLIIILFGTTSVLGSQGRSALVLASSAALAGIGVYQLLSALN